jgi:hypothetical protein
VPGAPNLAGHSDWICAGSGWRTCEHPKDIASTIDAANLKPAYLIRSFVGSASANVLPLSRATARERVANYQNGGAVAASSSGGVRRRRGYAIQPGYRSTILHSPASFRRTSVRPDPARRPAEVLVETTATLPPLAYPGKLSLSRPWASGYFA